MFEDVKILTHDDWESFGGLDGSSQALRRANNSLYNQLNKAFYAYKDSVKAGKRGPDILIAIAQKAKNNTKKILDKLGAWGFCDTEPQSHLCDFFEQKLNLPYGSINR